MALTTKSGDHSNGDAAIAPEKRQVYERRMGAFLVDASGVKVPITAEGVVVGRDAACGVMVPDPKVSRRHALFVRTTQGTQLLCLAEQGVTVNGTVQQTSVWLKQGDVVALPGAQFTVEIAEASAADAPWMLEHGTTRFRIAPHGFVVGGGDHDDLVIRGWPPSAVTLHLVEDGVVAQVDAPMNVAGRTLHDVLQRLGDRDVIAHRDVRLRLRRAMGHAASTIGATRAPRPTQVRLEFAPRGGVLRVRLREEHVVFLPDRRCDLVAVLLQPPDGVAGDLVPDDALVPRVWGADGATRTQLNTLIHRVRKTLTAAGLDGAALIERARRGGATRFVVADDAAIVVG